MNIQDMEMESEKSRTERKILNLRIGRLSLLVTMPVYKHKEVLNNNTARPLRKKNVKAGMSRAAMRRRYYEMARELKTVHSVIDEYPNSATWMVMSPLAPRLPEPRHPVSPPDETPPTAPSCD